MLFFIHGGGFAQGSGDNFFYGPDFIMEKQTILVTINYRLGIFGFLSLNSIEYSGNMGLKDQQLALKWISSNIGQFGGDSNRITVFGHSAGKHFLVDRSQCSLKRILYSPFITIKFRGCISGAVSANYHILSSESRKYFQNAVPMSGSAGNYWALSEEDNHLRRAFQIAEQLGEPKYSFEHLMAVLRTVSAGRLNQLHFYEANTDDLLSATIFGPVIENMQLKISPFRIGSFDSTNVITISNLVNVL